MSGGHFDYKQYAISDIYESIQHELDIQGKLKPKEELYMREDYYDEYPEDRFFTTYSSEVQKEFKKAIKILKKAQVYAQRIDYFLSSDDGEEQFLKRLKDDLSKIESHG